MRPADRAASAPGAAQGDRRLRNRRRLRIAGAVHRHPRIRGRAHRLARDAAVADRAGRHRELLPVADAPGQRVLTQEEIRPARQLNYQLIVFAATFDCTLVVPPLFTVTTAKYHVPALRLSTT